MGVVALGAPSYVHKKIDGFRLDARFCGRDGRAPSGAPSGALNVMLTVMCAWRCCKAIPLERSIIQLLPGLSEYTQQS